jgi:tagatose 1,6-diphosphate aldolase
MPELTLGKVLGLSRASRDGVFGVLALDHQDALRRALRPHAPAQVTDNELTRFKLMVVQALSPCFTAVLHDPVWGGPQAVAANLASGGLLVELEKADYGMAPLPLHVEIRPGWSVSKIKRMGADGVKLFFYYHPDAAMHCAIQEAVIAAAVRECTRYDIPLYAEPVRYPLPNEDAISPAYAADMTRVVVESARRVAALGADVLKLEFPVDARHSTDEALWLRACEQVSSDLGVPWTLLSAGVDFETFARQVRCACQGGASGFIAGRAVWGEACALPEKEREQWLCTVARDRMQHLLDIAAAAALPWTRHYAAEPVDTEWYRRYQEPYE